MKQPRLHFYRIGEGVTAFSSTRQGGYSEGRYGEFNINRYCGDDEQHIRQNRASLCELLGIREKRLIMPHQVHEAEIIVVDNDFLQLSDTEQQQRLERNGGNFAYEYKTVYLCTRNKKCRTSRSRKRSAFEIYERGRFQTLEG